MMLLSAAKTSPSVYGRAQVQAN